MINTKNDLKLCLEKEKSLYVAARGIDYWRSRILNTPNYRRWILIKSLRYSEYYFNRRKDSLFFALLNILYSRKKNIVCAKNGIEIESKSFASGLLIHHSHGIVVNGDACIGENCQLHGANVIGNMGTDLKAPVIGKNVRLGVGAKVLGDVYIADNVRIGAGALVIESCYEEGVLLVGVPAKKK